MPSTPLALYQVLIIIALVSIGCVEEGTPPISTVLQSEPPLEPAPQPTLALRRLNIALTPPPTTAERDGDPTDVFEGVPPCVRFYEFAPGYRMLPGAGAGTFNFPPACAQRYYDALTVALGRPCMPRETAFQMAGEPSCLSPENPGGSCVQECLAAATLLGTIPTASRQAARALLRREDVARTQEHALSIPSPEQIEAALRAERGRVAECIRGTDEPVVADITWSADGAPSRVQLDAAFAGSQHAPCLEGVLSDVRVPRFLSPTYTLPHIVFR